MCATAAVSASAETVDQTANEGAETNLHLSISMILHTPLQFPRIELTAEEHLLNQG